MRYGNMDHWDNFNKALLEYNLKNCATVFMIMINMSYCIMINIVVVLHFYETKSQQNCYLQKKMLSFRSQESK